MSVAAIVAMGLLSGLETVAAAANSRGTSGHHHHHQRSTASNHNKSSEILVGLMGDFTGPLASSADAVRPAVQAWASSVNARGGINGHKVNLIIEDDKNSPTVSLEDAKKLIDQDHVIGMIEISNSDMDWADVAQNAHVPVIPATSSTATTLQFANFFSPGATVDSLPGAVAIAAKKARVKKLALLYCAEAAQCSQLTAPIRSAAAKSGVPMTFSGSISASAPNFTAPCLAAQQSGADGLFVGDAATVLQSVGKSCVQQGYTPTMIAEDGAVSKSLRTTPGWDDGMIAVQPNIPFFVKNTPATKAMFKAFNKYQPASVKSPNFNEFAIEGWAAAKLFEAAAKAGKLGVHGTPTSQQLFNGFYSLNGTTLGGLAPPLSYKRGQPNSISCWYLMRTENKKFTTPYGLKPVCIPQAGKTSSNQSSK